MTMNYVVIVEIIQEDENPLSLPPCGIFSSIDLAREYIKDTFETASVSEEWNETFNAEVHKTESFDGTHEEIYIWGREVDER